MTRYASIGAIIHVYWLHQEDDNFSECAWLEKDRHSKVQVPGCFNENKNGIYLPHRISNPIKEAEISYDWVHGWESALENLKDRIRQNVGVTEQYTTQDTSKQVKMAEAGTL